MRPRWAILAASLLGVNLPALDAVDPPSPSPIPTPGPARLPGLFWPQTAPGHDQSPPVPQIYLYREPWQQTWPVRVVEPSDGLPLTIARTQFTPTRLRLTAELSGRRIPVPVRGLTLRVAVGPQLHGMWTFRMHPVEWHSPQSPLPGGAAWPIFAEFAIANDDYAPPMIAFRRNTAVVVTLERIVDEDGTVLFENPDSTELLWEALGRPSA